MTALGGRRSLLGAACVLPLLGVLCGCGAATPTTAILPSGTPSASATTTSTARSDALAGTQWLLTTLMFGGGSRAPTGPSPALQFAADGTVTYSDGCNAGGGTYDVVGAHLDLQLIGTQKACDDTDSQQVARVLRSTPWFTFEAGTLTLYDGTPAGSGLAYTPAPTS